MIKLIKNEITILYSRKKTLFILLIFIFLISFNRHGLYKQPMLSSEPNSNGEFDSIHYIIGIIQLLGTVLLAVILTTLTSNVGVEEYKLSSSKLMLSGLISRGKVYLSKYIAAVISSICFICLVEIIAFIIFGLIWGFGDIKYPVRVGLRFQYDLNAMQGSVGNGTGIIQIPLSYHTIPMYQYLLETLMLQMLFIVACVSFILMISSIVKNSSRAISIILVSVIAVTLLGSSSKVTNFIASFTFIIYGDATSTLNGDYAYITSLPYINLGFIISILILWSVVCYIIGHIAFVRRKILIMKEIEISR